MTSDVEPHYPLLKKSRMLDKCAELEASKQRIGKDDKVSNPKIQRVPLYMGGRAEFEKFYLPKLISIGPSHHKKPYVELGERYKAMWTAMYLQDTNQTAHELCENFLFHHCDQTKYPELFSNDCWSEHVGHYDGKNLTVSVVKFAWMLLMDGCSILQVLDKSGNSVDPEQELKVSMDQLVRVHQDLLLLENQIPYQVLQLLCKDQAKLKKCMHNFLKIHGIGKPDLGREKEHKVKKYMHNFLQILGMGREKENTSTVGEVLQEHKVMVQEEDEDEDVPVHLLDYLRRALLKRGHPVQIPGEPKINRKSLQDVPVQPDGKVEINRKSLHLRKYRIGSIRELKAAGIRVVKHPNNTSVYPRFDAGELQLPELIVDGSTALIFLNLIAYEMCPDFRNDLEISSYIVFLSSLIDQPEDVKELRSADILINELASDKEVADLFNKMDTVLVAETARYAQIRNQIEAHFKSKRGKIKMLGWMGEAYITYFRSPWTIIALLAAALGLVLTFIQTWFAIHPKGS